MVTERVYFDGVSLSYCAGSTSNLGEGGGGGAVIAWPLLSGRKKGFPLPQEAQQLRECTVLE